MKRVFLTILLTMLVFGSASCARAQYNYSPPPSTVGWGQRFWIKWTIPSEGLQDLTDLYIFEPGFNVEGIMASNDDPRAGFSTVTAQFYYNGPKLFQNAYFSFSMTWSDTLGLERYETFQSAGPIYITAWSPPTGGGGS